VTLAVPLVLLYTASSAAIAERMNSLLGGEWLLARGLLVMGDFELVVLAEPFPAKAEVI